MQGMEVSILFKSRRQSVAQERKEAVEMVQGGALVGFCIANAAALMYKLLTLCGLYLFPIGSGQ